MPADIPAILRTLAFTRELGPDDLNRLAAMAQLVEWREGETVFHEGDHGELLYLVVEGRVALEVNALFRRVRILTVEPGEAFGWSSIFYRKPKTASATATRPTRALALDASRLRELSQTDTRFGYWLARRLLELVSDRLKVTRMQLLDLFKY